MSRYIDADALIKHIKNMPWKMTSAAEIMKFLFLTTVEEAPTADVVEVVRCKDCRWCDVSNWDGEILYGCDCCSGMNDVAPDYYCSYGERREENEG